MKLVNGEKLQEKLEEINVSFLEKSLTNPSLKPAVSFQLLASIIKECTLSPAELGGDSWVLENTKASLKESMTEAKDIDLLFLRPSDILTTIKDLESQAPVSELEQKAKENERKAEILKRLEKEIQKMSDIDVLEKSDKERKTWAKVLIRFIKGWDSELLAQSEKP